MKHRIPEDKRMTIHLQSLVNKEIEKQARELVIMLNQRSISSLIAFLIREKWDSLKNHPFGDKMVEKL